MIYELGGRVIEYDETLSYREYSYTPNDSETKMLISDERIKVFWEYIGEGLHGDYNKDDPEDIPLLRYSAEYKNNETDEWEYIDGYCTTVPVDTPESELKKKLEVIFKTLRTLYKEDEPDGVRTISSILSWI